MKAIDKPIYDILNKYIDMSYVQYHKNVNGIEIAKYSDSRDYSPYYMCELCRIGFEWVEYNDIMSAEYLCGISYCEGDLMIAYYKDIDEFNKEKERTIKFYRDNQ